ncbi:MAG: DUF58 domain-containing protein [Armatimonadetes bacterium]|nr:DUF58 domain-containing protein [Armatimonadota bacterium]
MELWRLKFMSLFFAAAFMLVVAIRLNIDQMYLMAGILVSIPLVSYILGNLALKNVTVRRSGAETCFEGDPVEVEIVIEGANDLMRNLLSARDVTSEWISVESVTPDPDRPGHLRERLVARRRGRYVFTAAEIIASDPLGLFLFRRQVPLHSELVVYPVPLELPEAFLGREARSGREQIITLSRRGETPEMHSTREYQPGDELRYVHWPSTARTGRFIVKDREEPTDRTTMIALDLRQGSEMGIAPHTSLDTAARLAAAVAREALAEGEAVALLLPEEEILPLHAGRGTDHYYELLENLARARANSPVPLGEAIMQHAAQGHARLVFFTAVPDAFLLQGLSAWTAAGGSATGILLDPMAGEIPTETSGAHALEQFAASAEEIGAAIHRLPLNVFYATRLEDWTWNAAEHP